VALWSASSTTDSTNWGETAWVQALEVPNLIDPGSLIVRLQAPNPDVPITDARAPLQLERQLRIVSNVAVRSHGRSRGAVQLRAVVHDGAIPENREGSRSHSACEPRRLEDDVQ
jgi:hypothetical protein